MDILEEIFCCCQHTFSWGQIHWIISNWVFRACGADPGSQLYRPYLHWEHLMRNWQNWYNCPRRRRNICRSSTMLFQGVNLGELCSVHVYIIHYSCHLPYVYWIIHGKANVECGGVTAVGDPHILDQIMF